MSNNILQAGKPAPPQGLTQAQAPQPQANKQPTSTEKAFRQTSLDRATLARWRFSETNGFVIKDFTDLDEEGEPTCTVIKSSYVFDVLADALENNRKISVYAIGPCVLDQT